MAQANHAHEAGGARARHHHGAEAHACSSGGAHGGKAYDGFAIDPVCGMRVNLEDARHRFAYRGEEYFFCSGRCRERFAAEPEKFLKPKPAEPDAPEGSIYTCPMHPEVRQVGPGSCPICGMALEPLVASLAEEEPADPELADMTRRFWL